MPFYPILFLFVTFSGWILSIIRGPFWGLLTYVFVYFNIPNSQWWGIYVPDLRWSFTSAAILIASCCLHYHQLNFLSLRFFYGLKGLAALLLLMLAIIPFSPNPALALDSIYDFLRYIIIFFLVAIIINNTKRLKLYLYVILSQVLYLSWISRYYFTGTRLDNVGITDAAEANMFAMLLLSALPFFVSIAFGLRKPYRIIPYFSILIVLNAFAMCRSRGAMLGFIVSAFFMVAGFRQFISKKIIVFACILATIISFSIFDKSFIARITELSSETSGSGRIEIWKQAIPILRDYPFGAGGRSFVYLSPQYISADRLTGSGIRASHNTFLLILVEQGIIGLLLYLYFISELFRGLFKARIELFHKSVYFSTLPTEFSLLYALLIATTSSLAGMVVSSFFIDRLYYECFYLLAALSPVIFHLVQQPQAFESIDS